MLRKYLYFVVFTAFFSCDFNSGQPTALSSALKGKSIDIAYAENYKVEDMGNHKLLTISDAWEGAKAQTVVMSSTTSNQDLKEAIFLGSEAKRIVCLSTTHVAMLSAISQEWRIVGASGTKYICSPAIQKMLSAGKLTEVGMGESPNIELIISLKPDLVLANSTGGGSTVLAKLKDFGIPVLYTSEYREKSPLARAEWVRLMGIITNNEQKADEFFFSEAQEYEALKKMVLSEERPTVFCGLPEKGTWYVPGGKSYVAQYIKDAGGDYLWQEDGSRGGVPLSFEEVYGKAKDADYWLDVIFAKSLDDIASTDPRLASFDAFKNQRVFNYDRKKSSGGGYDIFEYGVVSPHLILADLMKVFYPHLVPDHEFVFYRKLGEGL